MRRFCSPQMPPNLPFFVSVQSIIHPSLAAPAGDQEVIAHQLTHGNLNGCNRVANPLLQQPPFRDAFYGVLGLRVLQEVGEYLISQRTVWIDHALLVSIRYAKT
jgi:hypothetical protein